MEDPKEKKQCISKEFPVKWRYTSEQLQLAGDEAVSVEEERTGAQGESFPWGGRCWTLSWRMSSLVTWSDGWEAMTGRPFRWEQPLWAARLEHDKGTSPGGWEMKLRRRVNVSHSNFTLCHAEKFGFWPLGRWIFNLVISLVVRCVRNNLLFVNCWNINWEWLNF